MQNSIWRRGGHEFFRRSVWAERGGTLPFSGSSSIQTANRPPAGRFSVAKRFIKGPLSRRGVKGSGVAAAEVRATMPRFDCQPEIRLIWTDAHGLKSKQPCERICPPQAHTLAACLAQDGVVIFPSLLTKPSWTIVSLLSARNFCKVSVFYFA